MNNNYLFVYGTLRRHSKNTRHELLQTHANFISEARFQGRMYLTGNYPGVIFSENKNDWVVGEVYQLHNKSIILPKLDDYEECSAEFPQPTEYIRMLQKVFVADGSSCNAWIYIYNWPMEKLERITSGDFNSFCGR